MIRKIENFGREGSLGRNIALTYVFAFVSSIVGFLIVVIFSGLLPPEEWGAFSVAKRAATLASTVALLGVSVAVTRYIPLERAKRSDYADYYGTNAINIVIRSTVTVVLIWIVGVYVFTRIQVVDEALRLPLYAATAFIVALMWQLLLTSFLRAEGFIQRFNQMTVSGQILQLLFGSLAILVLGASAYLAISGAAVGIVIVVGLSLTMLARLSITIFRKEYINNEVKSEILSYGIPRMGMGIFDVLIVSTSLILLGFSGMTAEAGFLAIGLQFVAMMTLLFQPIAVVMLPEFSKLHGLSNKGETEKKLRILLQGWSYLIGLIVILLITFIDPIFPFLFKADYEPAIGLIKILLIGMVPFSFYLTTYSYINAMFKRPYLLYFLIAGVAVNVLIYVLSVPSMGETGAALATGGGMLTLGVMVALLLVRFQPGAFGNIKFLDYIVCSTPLLVILGIGWLSTGLILHIGLALILLLLYVYLLKWRKLEWFEVLLDSIKKKTETRKGTVK